MTRIIVKTCVIIALLLSALAALTACGRLSSLTSSGEPTDLLVGDL